MKAFILFSPGVGDWQIRAFFVRKGYFMQLSDYESCREATSLFEDVFITKELFEDDYLPDFSFSSFSKDSEND
jgi:hypothetical protein